MKRFMLLAAAMIVLTGMAVTPAVAADATAALDVASAYVWRGQTFNDGLVLQPSVDVAAKNGFGINVWGNYDIDDYDGTLDSHEFSEIDLTVSYGTTLGKVDVGVGAIGYFFPAGGEETWELYLSLGVPIIGGLSAGLDFYYDVDAVDEFTYATLSLAYAFDITAKLGLELGGSIAYAGDAFAENAGGEDGGLYDYTLSAALGYAFTDAWSASAGVTYVNALDDDNLPDVDDGGLEDTNIVFSVGIAYAF